MFVDVGFDFMVIVYFIYIIFAFIYNFFHWRKICMNILEHKYFFFIVTIIIMFIELMLNRYNHIYLLIIILLKTVIFINMERCTQIRYKSDSKPN